MTCLNTAAEPVAVVSTTQDNETLSLFDVIVSPSEKTSAVLSVPVLLYILQIMYQDQ